MSIIIVTTIQRDSAGTPTGIVSPFGQLTSLSVNADELQNVLFRGTKPLANARVVQNAIEFRQEISGIVVHDATAMDVLYKAVWNGMNAALVAGDKTTALSFLTSGAQEKYGPVFDVLLPHMADITASYSPPRNVSMSEALGEYAITRVSNGKAHLFLIYFLKDADGVWRLEAM